MKKVLAACALLASMSSVVVGWSPPNVGVSGRCWIPDRDFPDEVGNPYAFSCPSGTFCCYGALYDELGLLDHARFACCTNGLCCHSVLVLPAAQMSTTCQSCPSHPGDLDPDGPGELP